MAVLLVTFDAQQEGQDYKKVAAFLKHYKHVFLADGSYAIDTYEATRTIYNKLSAIFTDKVHFFVVTITKPYTSQCLDDVKKWLYLHLPQE